MRHSTKRVINVRPRVFSILAAATLAVGLATPASADTMLFGPTSYVRFADSPFFSLIGTSTYFYLETFEDGSLNTPGVQASPGSVIGPLDGFVDSVDADDGTIDGSGADGHSWYSNFTQSSFTFTFDQTALGDLPTYAGIVWTDCGFNSPEPFFCNITFNAFGPSGNLLGSIGPAFLGDGFDSGQTAEDRFLGVFDPGGISAIQISTDGSADWEVDNLQYGRTAAVPEPATLTLVGLGTAALFRFRARRRQRPSK